MNLSLSIVRRIRRRSKVKVTKFQPPERAVMASSQSHPHSKTGTVVKVSNRDRHPSCILIKSYQCLYIGFQRKSDLPTIWKGGQAYEALSKFLKHVEFKVAIFELGKDVLSHGTLRFMQSNLAMAMLTQERIVSEAELKEEKAAKSKKKKIGAEMADEASKSKDVEYYNLYELY